MDYSIGEFSKVTGLGIHTLRYYEHENLIIPLRNASNRRRYSEKNIAWIVSANDKMKENAEEKM